MNETYMTPGSPAGKMTKERTPEVVGAEVRNLTAAAKYLTVWYAVEIGRRLTEAKELVAHGEWLEWLKRETEFSQPTASRFMRIYAEYGADQGNLFGAETKYSTLNNLSVSNALKLLAVPEEERESFAAEVDAEHLSTRELEQAIRERDEAKKALAEAEQTVKEFSEQNVELTDGIALAEAQVEASEKLRAELADELAGARSEFAAAKQRIAELESRPIDVAVQEPDPAEIERRAREIAAEERRKAEEKARETAEKAKAAEEKLREKLRAAEEKLAEAKQAELTEARRAEVVAPYEAEIAKLKKQINMSEAKIANFTARFLIWQGAYNALMEALRDVPEENRSKCAAAVSAQLENWMGAV